MPSDIPNSKPRALITPLALVEARAIGWLWPQRIPLGKLTVLQGDPKLGKSLLTADLAARVSSGRAWPDTPDTSNRPGSVVIVSAEDDLADTIRPRLDAAGADVSRIVSLGGIQVPGREHPDWWTLAELGPLEEAIAEDNARLVIVDPVTAYAPSGTDTHRTSDVRALLGPLSKLAAARGVAIVLVSHLNKSGGGSALYRGTGSLAWNAAARAVWLVAQDPADTDRRLLLNAGGNLAADPLGLAFRIEGDPPSIVWEPGAVTMTANEALASRAMDDAGSESTDAAVEWLSARLRNGPVSGRSIYEEARNRGISRGALSAAKTRLGVIVRPTGFQASWMWSLPEQSDPAP